MIVVVEGPDGSGKSTLIDNLRVACSRHFVSLRRSGRPKDADDIHQVLVWVAQARNLSVPLVLDRHPIISESVYGPILRGSNLLDDSYNEEAVKMILRDTVNRVIYCRPPTGVVHERLHANPQLKGVVDKIDEITQRYDSMMRVLQHWGVYVIWYDWTAEHEADSADLQTLFFGNYDGNYHGR